MAVEAEAIFRGIRKKANVLELVLSSVSRIPNTRHHVDGATMSAPRGVRERLLEQNRHVASWPSPFRRRHNGHGVYSQRQTSVIQEFSILLCESFNGGLDKP